MLGAPGFMTGVGRHKIMEWNVCVVLTDSAPPLWRAVVQTEAGPEAVSHLRPLAPTTDWGPGPERRLVSSAGASQQTASAFVLD